MSLRYLDDANELTSFLQTGLALTGFVECIAESDELLSTWEEDYFDLRAIAESLFANRNQRAAFDLFIDGLDSQWFADLMQNVSSDLSIFEDRHSLLQLESRDFWNVIRAAANLFQGFVFQVEAPLNVIAMLLTLHRLIIVPSLNLRDAKQRMNTAVGTCFIFCDADGMPDRDEFEAGVDDADVFWNLFDVVEREFADELQNGGAPGRLLETAGLIDLSAYLNVQARTLATTVFNQIQLDRRE